MKTFSLLLYLPVHEVLNTVKPRLEKNILSDLIDYVWCDLLGDIMFMSVFYGSDLILSPILKTIVSSLPFQI